MEAKRSMWQEESRASEAGQRRGRRGREGNEDHIQDIGHHGEDFSFYSEGEDLSRRVTGADSHFNGILPAVLWK